MRVPLCRQKLIDPSPWILAAIWHPPSSALVGHADERIHSKNVLEYFRYGLSVGRRRRALRISGTLSIRRQEGSPYDGNV